MSQIMNLVSFLNGWNYLTHRIPDYGYIYNALKIEINKSEIMLHVVSKSKGMNKIKKKNTQCHDQDVH